MPLLPSCTRAETLRSRTATGKKIFYVQAPYWYPCTVSESSLLVFTRASLRAIVRQSYSQAQCQWQGKRYYTGRPLRIILLHTMSDRCPGGNELAVTGTLLANGNKGTTRATTLSVNTAQVRLVPLQWRCCFGAFDFHV